MNGASEEVTERERVEGILPASEKALRESEAGFREVLAAKVRGTLVLNEVLAGTDPDFICYFSSASALLGDLGSCDYAIANRFQMAYASAAVPRGRHVSIQWPLWNEGGMDVGNPGDREQYLRATSQRALKTQEGLDLLEGLLAEGADHTLIIAEVSACDYRDTTPLVFYSSRYHLGPGIPFDR